jgi:hypothetical protein
MMYERVAGIDVHQDMIKVGIRAPGHRAWTRTSELLEYRTFHGVLLTMAAALRPIVAGAVGVVGTWSSR